MSDCPEVKALLTFRFNYPGGVVACRRNKKYKVGDGKNQIPADQAEILITLGRLLDTNAALVKALSEIDHSDDKQWTKEGEPAIRYLEKKAKCDTNREEIERLSPDLVRIT